MTEAPVGIRGGSPQLPTYETEPHSPVQPRIPIEATPTYRASGLVLGSWETVQPGKPDNRYIFDSEKEPRATEQVSTMNVKMTADL
jgi:hypothetical protein